MTFAYNKILITAAQLLDYFEVFGDLNIYLLTTDLHRSQFFNWKFFIGCGESFVTGNKSMECYNAILL